MARSFKTAIIYACIGLCCLFFQKSQAQDTWTNTLSFEEIFRSELDRADSLKRVGFDVEALDLYFNLIEKKATFSPRAQTRLHINVAQLLFSMKLNDEARKQVNIAISLSVNPTGEQYVARINAFALLAAIEMDEGRYDSAMVAFTNNENLSKKQGRYLFVASAINNQGICKMRQGSYSEAISLFERARKTSDSLALTAEHKDPYTDLRFSIMDNIAETYTLLGLTRSANDIYKDILNQLDTVVISEMRKRARWVQTVILQSALPPIYSRNDTIFQNLVACVDSIEMLPKRDSKNEYKPTLYIELSKRFMENNNAEEAQQWLNRALMEKDDQAQKRTIKLNSILVSTSNYKLNQLRKQKRLENQLMQEKLDHEADTNQKRTAQGVLVLVLAFGFIAFLWLYLKRRIQTQKNLVHLNEVQNQLLEEQLKNEELEKQRIQDSLSHNQKDLSNLSHFLGKQQQWAAALVNINKTYKKEGIDMLSEQIDKLVHEMENELLLDEKQALINERIEEIGSQFVSNIRKQFPNLTSNEIELCSLIRLRLSNKEIARIRNISDESARKARYRLKKKMGFKETQNLEEELSKAG